MMSRVFLTILSDVVIFMMAIFFPILLVISTDRFREPPSPRNYALLLAMAVVFGALMFVPAIAIVAATALLAFAIAWVSAHFALSGVSYQRTLQPARLFAGDTADLVLRFKNEKFLPLAWLSITDPLHGSLFRVKGDLSNALRISGGLGTMEDLGYALINHTSIGPFQEVVRTYRVEGAQRGVYSIGPAQVVTGDPFGLFRREAEMAGRTEVIVYPRIYPTDTISFPFREALGELRTRRTLFEDPTLIAGSREYRPGDPLKRIHWKSTARTGDLQVRVFDPSTTAHLMIVVNLNTFQHLWQGVDPERMEAAISVAATLGTWALERDYAVGISSNGTLLGAEGLPRLPASASPQQATRLLEHLARLSYAGNHSPEYVLMEEARRLSVGGSIVFVTPLLTPELIGILTSRRLSSRVSVVYCGRHAAPVVRGLRVHLFMPPEEERAVS